MNKPIFKTAIIGLGEISDVSMRALAALPDMYRAESAVDIVASKRKSWTDKTGLNVYANVNDLIETEKPEVAIVSTPPKAHAPVVSELLRAGGIKVLCEKPLALKCEDIDLLYRAAETSRDGSLNALYHAAYGRDVDFFIDNRQSIQRKYALGDLTGIKCEFFDRYMPGGVLDRARINLGGSFTDGGVNALSVCARIVDINEFVPIDYSEKLADGVVVNAVAKYRHGGKTIEIRTEWGDVNCKKTTVFYENGYVVLAHSDRKVIAVTRSCEKIFPFTDTERLFAQYVSTYKNAYEALCRGESDYAKTAAIHNKLFAFRNRL